MPDTTDNPAPKITVIVPTYNCAHLLPRALDSLLAQTFQDFEIIISDDGSTDNTKDVVQPYLADPRIRYDYGEHAGVSATRNRAIRSARGEFIVRLDSDDTLPPASLERHLEIVEREGTDWARTAFQRIEGNEVRLMPLHVPAENAVEHVLLHGWSGQAIFFRRESLNRIGGYDEALRFFEDYDMDMRLLLDGARMSAIQEPLYNYHIQAVSALKGPGSVRRLYGLERYYRTYLKPAGRENPAVRRVYAIHMATLARAYSQEAGWRPALRAAFEATMADPAKPFRGLLRLLKRGKA